VRSDLVAIPALRNDARQTRAKDHAIVLARGHANPAFVGSDDSLDYLKTQSYTATRPDACFSAAVSLEAGGPSPLDLGMRSCSACGVPGSVAISFRMMAA
jgi:hypothetical protein